MKTTDLILLESVGNYYNTKTGYVYPIQSNLEPDLNLGMKVSECTDEFLESMSSKDYNKILRKEVKRLQKENKNLEEQNGKLEMQIESFANEFGYNVNEII